MVELALRASFVQLLQFHCLFSVIYVYLYLFWLVAFFCQLCKEALFVLSKNSTSNAKQNLSKEIN